MTSTNTSTRRAAAPRRMLAGLASAAVLAAGVGLASGSPTAQADPGDTFVPLGTSQLVQSEDLSSIQLPYDTAAVSVARDGDFSSCLGEDNPWTSVLPGSPKPFRLTWTTAKGHGALYETLAQAPTERDAKRFAKTLQAKAVRDCQGTRSPWDFHFGPTTTDPVGSATATWALTYKGSSSRATGGIVVLRKGTTVGLVEVTTPSRATNQQLESIAKVTASRLT